MYLKYNLLDFMYMYLGRYYLRIYVIKSNLLDFKYMYLGS